MDNHCTSAIPTTWYTLFRLISPLQFDSLGVRRPLAPSKGGCLHPEAIEGTPHQENLPHKGKKNFTVFLYATIVHVIIYFPGLSWRRESG